MKYIYTFQLENFNGVRVGWNDCIASNMAEARKIAKRDYTTQPKWIKYDVLIDGERVGTKEWYLGMRPALKTFKRTSVERSVKNHQEAYIRSL